MRFFDAHMHCFPDFLASRALLQMSEAAKVPYFTDGTVNDVLKHMDESGVEKGLFLHIATKPGQAKKVNDFAVSIQSERIFSFGSVHPYDEDAETEMLRCKQMGLYGFKFHFDYQKVPLDDPKMDRIWKMAIELDMPVAMHAGWDPYSPGYIHAPVQKIAVLSDRFPDLKIFAAHLGGMKRYDEVAEYLAGRENVWLDTAMCAKYCRPDQFEKIVSRHDIRNLLFGSDSPWDDQKNEIDYVLNSVLPKTCLQDVFYNNLARFLKIEE